MKDKKFIILLVFITIVALVNVIWLTNLQAEVNKSLRPGKFMSEMPNAYHMDKLYVGDLCVLGSLGILDDLGNLRIYLHTPKNGASISIFDPDNKLRICSKTEGSGKDAYITMPLPPQKNLSFEYAGITLVTAIDPMIHLPKIEVCDLQGNRTVYASYGQLKLPANTK